MLQPESEALRPSLSRLWPEPVIKLHLGSGSQLRELQYLLDELQELPHLQHHAPASLLRLRTPAHCSKSMGAYLEARPLDWWERAKPRDSVKLDLQQPQLVHERPMRLSRATVNELSACCKT